MSIFKATFTVIENNLYSGLVPDTLMLNLRGKAAKNNLCLVNTNFCTESSFSGRKASVYCYITVRIVGRTASVHICFTFLHTMFFSLVCSFGTHPLAALPFEEIQIMCASTV